MTTRIRLKPAHERAMAMKARIEAGDYDPAVLAALDFLIVYGGTGRLVMLPEWCHEYIEHRGRGRTKRLTASP